MLSKKSMEDSTSNLGISGVVTWLLVFMMVFAPIFRAGLSPIPLLILELSAVMVFLLVLWNPGAGRRLARGEVFAVALLLLFPLLYIIPLPGVLWDWLPGRGPYAETLSLLGDAELRATTTLSLYPIETESAWLVLLVPTAIFLGTRMLDSGRLSRLVPVLFVVAGVQATLGLMQFGGGPDSPLYLGTSYAHRYSSVGTYTNYNHLAGLLAMILPLVLALFLFSLGHGEEPTARKWRGRIVFFASRRGHATFIYGALALLLILGVIFTRSRMGTALTMLGLVLVVVAFSRRIGGDNVYGPAGTVAAVAVGLGSVIGLAPVLNRFASLDPFEDLRWTMFSDTSEGIGVFFPIGSGPGTFPDVFHVFQSKELGRMFINHAHNDYLEWLFDGGVFAAVLIVLMLVLYFLRWGKVWSEEAWSRFRFIQVGAGIGILLLSLHETMDYNLFTPANMVYFAFLVGVFFSDPDEEKVRERRRLRKHRIPPREPAAPDDAVRSKIRAPSPSPDQIKNPFLD